MDKTKHISPLRSTEADSSTGVDAALSDVALIDQSSVGKIRVAGADRLDLLHRLSTNDLLSLKPFSSRGTVFTTDKGRIVDYVRVLVFPTSLLLLTSPDQESRLKNWIDKYTIMEDIQLQVVTSELAMYSIVGPRVMSFAGVMLSDVPPPNVIQEISVGDANGFMVHQSEFGIDSINIILPVQNARETMEEHLHKRGVELTMMSQQAGETYRITHGIPGEVELTESFNPYEVNLKHAISFTKGCYIGQEVIARLDTYQKVQRRLVGVRLDHNIPISNLAVPLLRDSEQVGLLTSVASISLNGEYEALGVAKSGGIAVGDTVEVQGESFGAEGIIVRSFD